MDEETGLEGLIPWPEVAENLSKFGVKKSVETLRTTLKGLSISHVRYGRPPGKASGRTTYYDPLVVWVLAVYFHYPSDVAPGPEWDLNSCRTLAAESSPHLRRKRGEKADPRLERQAYYQFITDPRTGLDLRKLNEVLYREPDVLDLSADGREFFEEVMRYYIAGVTGSVLQREVDVDSVPLVLDEEHRDMDFRDADRFDSLMERAGLTEPAEVRQQIDR